KKLRERINELQEKETALLKQEAVWKDIVSTVGEGIAYTSLTGEVLWVNQRIVQMLEKPAEYFIGRNIMSLALEMLDPREYQLVIPLLKHIVAGKTIEPFRFNYNNKQFELDARINLHTRKLTGIIRDITASCHAEEELINKNKDLSRLFDITLNLLESVDKKKVLTSIVENASRLAGSDTSAIYMINGGDLRIEVTYPPLPDDYPEEFKYARLDHHSYIKRAAETQVVQILEDTSKASLTPQEKLVTETRNMRSLVYIPLMIEKVTKGVIILGTIGRVHNFSRHEIELFTTFSNITSLALENAFLFENLTTTKERAEESNRLKTAFLHNISHEIRTPLNAIIGFSGLLGSRGLEQDRKDEFVSIITQSNNQLLSIIDDIINISHIEAGQMKISAEKTDFGLILTNLYHQYLPLSEKTGIKFNIIASCPDNETGIITDESKIISVLTNLLNNAFKFTSRGTIELGCIIRNDKLEFYVRDTGPGIPQSEQQRIFERFYQVENTTAKLYGGMGLGLAIADAYVRLLGGQFLLDSSPGKGSRFAFTIPYVKASEDNSVQHGSTARSEKQAGKKTILVAEDEDSSYAFIQAVLNPLHYKVIRAANGHEAVEICSKHSDIDLVLMDIRMPVKNGYESTEEILRFRPGLPIIAQTAYGYASDRSTAFAKGCVDYITKPFSKDQLISVVRKYAFSGK
ncbi:MAG: response regulator, partial [Bacteroidales bacterium]|nr:response regulator [Bacteroidales bacterium]